MDQIRDLAGQPLFVAIIVAAVGGVGGGFLAGRKANLLTSAFIGAIFGTIAVILTRGMNIFSPIAYNGYSLVWAVLAGLLGAYVVERSPG